MAESKDSGGLVARVGNPYSSVDVPEVGQVTRTGLGVTKDQADKIAAYSKKTGIPISVTKKG